MKVKFFAEPNFYVRVSNKVIQRMSNLKGLQFDENGEYVTDNDYLINAMKIQFKHEEVKETEVEEIEEIEEVVESTTVAEKTKRGRSNVFK